MKNNNLNEEEKLKQMMDEATKNTQEAPVEPYDGKADRKKAFLVTGTALAVLGGLLFAGSQAIKSQDFEDKTETPDWVAEESEIISVTDEDIGEWSFEYPAKVPDWTKQPYSLELLADQEFLEQAFEFTEDFQEFQTYVAGMPSSVSGDWEDAPKAYTNDASLEYLEDGTLNPQYSYTLQEDYLQAYSVYLQRLINPIFGDWYLAQGGNGTPMKTNAYFNGLVDMFSNDWWESNIEYDVDYSAIPVMADWEGDNFGGLELAEVVPGRYGVFYGVVDEERQVTADSLGMDERGAEIIKISTPIIYSAFGQNDELIELKGMLNLTLESNEDIFNIHNRVVISHAELIME